LQFLADESCDFAVVSALRAVGHGVSAVAEVSSGADDELTPDVCGDRPCIRGLRIRVVERWSPPREAIEGVNLSVWTRDNCWLKRFGCLTRSAPRSPVSLSRASIARSTKAPKPRGLPRFGLDSIVSTRAKPRRFPGRKRVGAFTRRPDVARELEYLREAVEEAEAAARWYAERSATAAVEFSAELDAAESAIAQFPEAWPPFNHDTRRYLLRRFPFNVIYRVEPDRIVILAIAHARRRPGYWMSR
jgi:plasmid stabilization system protein ParE